MVNKDYESMLRTLGFEELELVRYAKMVSYIHSLLCRLHGEELAMMMIRSLLFGESGLWYVNTRLNLNSFNQSETSHLSMKEQVKYRIEDIYKQRSGNWGLSRK